MPFVVVKTTVRPRTRSGVYSAGGVAVVEPRRRRAAPLAADQDRARPSLPAQRAGLVRAWPPAATARAPPGERGDDGRGGAHHVEDDRGHAGERDPAHLLERERDVDHGRPAASVLVAQGADAEAEARSGG